ncbi:hypothetical protein D3C79_1025240 [compost metagenome]
MIVMQCRHEAVFSVKRYGISAGPSPTIFISINSGFPGECQQGPLHRITFYRPYIVMQAQYGIVAKTCCSSQFRQRGVRR